MLISLIRGDEMKLYNYSLMSLLLSTLVFSAFAGSKVDTTLDFLKRNKYEFAKVAGGFTAGAVLMYQDKVKAKTSEAIAKVTSTTKEKAKKLYNWFKSQSKAKKAAIIATPIAIALAYYYRGTISQKGHELLDRYVRSGVNTPDGQNG